MSASIQLRIAQQLFCHCAPDGVQLIFATLADGGCAILRDDEVLEVFSKDADSVQRAVTLFQHLTDGRAHISDRE